MSSTCTPSHRRKSNPPPRPPPTEPLPLLPSSSPLPPLPSSSTPPSSPSLYIGLTPSVWPHVAKKVREAFLVTLGNLICEASKISLPRPDLDELDDFDCIIDRCRSLAIVFCAQYAGQAKLVDASASLDQLICFALQLKSHDWRASLRPSLVKPLMDVAVTWDIFARAFTGVNVNLDALVDLVAATSDTRDLEYLIQEDNKQHRDQLFSLRPHARQSAGYPLLRRMANRYLAQADWAVAIDRGLKLPRECRPGDKGKGPQISQALPRNADDYFNAWLIELDEIDRRSASASTSSASTSSLLDFKPKRRAPEPPTTIATAPQQGVRPLSPSSRRPPLASQQQPHSAVVARAVKDTIARLEGTFDGPITQAQVDVDLHVLVGAGLSPRVQRRVIRAVKRRGRAKGVQL